MKKYYYCSVLPKGMKNTYYYIADEEVKVNAFVEFPFLREYQKEDIPYLAIFCKVKKQDVSEFEAVMKELVNKMIICGYTEYEQFCEKFINDILPEEKR